ncbi:MAG: hypothetical protein AAF739_05170 [Pseudomonadota bacterium]
MTAQFRPQTDVRRVYFQTLNRVVAGLLQSSDDVMVNIATRLDSLFKLLDKRDAGGLAVRTDRNDSGLPILADIIALARDVSARQQPETSSAALRQAVLDEMLARRRMPRALRLQEIGRAVYEEAVRHALPIFWPEIRTFEPVKQGGLRYTNWDHWDGGTNRPVFTQVWLKPRTQHEIEFSHFLAQARKFSGSGFTPLAAAIEFDDTLPTVALKRLKRWTLGPLYSPIFMDLPAQFGPLFDDLPPDDAWMFAWHEDEVLSVGTEATKSWFLAPTVYRETYAVDSTEPIAVERGASASRGHALMPHRVHQKLLGMGGAIETITRGMRLHSLSANGDLFEDV